MFVIFGWGRRTVRVLGWAPSQLCGHCHNERPWAVALIRRWFTLFFIPVFPYDSRYVAMCPVCSHGVDLDKVKASNLIQGSREIPAGEGPAGIAEPRQETVASGARSPRRRAYASLAFLGVTVALIVSMAMIVSHHASTGVAPLATSVSPTYQATPAASQPTRQDLEHLDQLVKGVLRLNNDRKAFPVDRNAQTLLAAQSSSLATKISAWRTSFPGANPPTIDLCSGVAGLARATAAYLHNPTTGRYRRYFNSMAAMNKAIDNYNWTANIALLGQ